MNRLDSLGMLTLIRWLRL